MTKDRFLLLNFKRRTRRSVWEVDESDLPMMAKWLIEIEEELKELKRDEKLSKKHDVKVLREER